MLTVIQAGHEDTGCTGFPVFICFNDLFSSVLIGQAQACPHHEPVAPVMHRSAAHAEAAHVPAFPQRDAQLVFCFKKCGHIIGLKPYIGIIVIPARGQIIVSDTFPVQFCPVNSQTCDLQNGTKHAVSRKTPDKDGLLDGRIGANPLHHVSPTFCRIVVSAKRVYNEKDFCALQNRRNADN